VLVVEDNPDALRLLKMLLEKAGCRVGTASDAASGLKAAQAEPIDTAVLDFGLQDMSGAELLCELKKLPQCADARFICLSGRSEQEIDWRALGFDHFLQKPASFEALRKLVAPRETTCRYE
jgi:DNA-binding response OmpR family regulator